MYVNGGSVIAVGIIFPVLGTLAVGARFIARVKHRAGLWADDWLCLPALAFLIATGALFIYGSIKHTIGYHSPPSSNLESVYQEDAEQQSLLLKLEYVIDMLNPIGTGLIRLSFLFFYRRIFRGRVFDIVSWTMISVVIAWIVSFEIVHLSICRDDLPAVWQSVGSIKTKCINTLLFLGLQGITSFILDLIILSIPFFWIWRLQMQTHQKWGVSSIFFVGLFTVGAGATRMVAGIEVLRYKWGIPQNVLGLKATSDTIGSVSVWLFWQYIEHGTGLVVCCLPALKPLVHFKSVFDVLSNLSSRASRKPLLRSSKNSSSSQRSSMTSTGSEDDIEKLADRITVTNTVDQYTIPRLTRT